MANSYLCKVIMMNVKNNKILLVILVLLIISFGVKVKVVTPHGIKYIDKSKYIFTNELNTKPFAMSGKVIRVIDGDTIDVMNIGRIRLADINAPELREIEGQKAKEFMINLCLGKIVYLDIDDIYVTDKYGRIIAIVYLPYNETHVVNVNMLLVVKKYAELRDYPNEFDPKQWVLYVPTNTTLSTVRGKSYELHYRYYVPFSIIILILLVVLIIAYRHKKLTSNRLS